MPVEILQKKDDYVLNHCAKYLARENTDPRHAFGQFSPDDLRSRMCEPWRFPIIDSYNDGKDPQASYAFNAVTFVYASQALPSTENVSVLGTFANLYEPIPLKVVKFTDAETQYHAVTIVIPKGEVHIYKFIVDGQLVLDPINPQRVVLDNGSTWSRFFTNLCTEPLSFEDWELQLLDRLTDHILPFRTTEGEHFLQLYYNGLDRQAKDTQYTHAYRLDQSVGVVNFIDKLVAREENHHLIDYKICLHLINQVLRQRNPYVEPAMMPREIYVELYEEMAGNSVTGWDYQQYNNPRYFLQLLRRHTITGAFSHPKYGGNVGGSAWAYLEERYRNPNDGQTLFNWRASIERPLGNSNDYYG